ncbi:hypothetical protein SAMN05216353_109117 [Halobacillus alkaliphilus]|uniref:DUF2158 domain-containing protein n=1 Tax=Halobacillus alkaliphilus TaxID=396056 RepID=A0A1I2LTX2_9BACI|nr:hypothetical protein [Halobacillus alkaliphilus]SFF80536.1 hypothetical protein SAMN05216353_109117 [Halobacillus alkaliphilus]
MGFSNMLNKSFKLGDKIKVISGAKKIDCDGTFIKAEDYYLVWSNGRGDILFTHLDRVTVKKV